MWCCRKSKDFIIRYKKLEVVGVLYDGMLKLDIYECHGSVVNIYYVTQRDIVPTLVTCYVFHRDPSGNSFGLTK
jgi:hypothetical protein